MTVEELIEELKMLPVNLPVAVWDQEYDAIQLVTSVNVREDVSGQPTNPIGLRGSVVVIK